MTTQRRFQGELYEGHKGHCAVTVPFDPREDWGAVLEPTGFFNSLGCPVRGTVNGVRFEGFIGYKYRRFWLLVDAPLRAEAGVAPGDLLDVVVRPRAGKLELAKPAPIAKKRSTKERAASPVRTRTTSARARR